jgi:putative FmdB family regulatory protein
MPIYEFECRDCGHVFEKIMRALSHTPMETCPACAGDNVEQKLSLVAPAGAGKRDGACAPTGG